MTCVIEMKIQYTICTTSCVRHLVIPLTTHRRDDLLYYCLVLDLLIYSMATILYCHRKSAFSHLRKNLFSLRIFQQQQNYIAIS